MGISLYRQYRPQKFSEVAGQSAAVEVITKSIARGRVGHAYLFSGSRGCGKTTVARLLAKALNCLNPQEGYEPCCECKNCLAIAAGESLDVIEIDGASNNSVDEVRELKSHVTLAPFSSKYKVYIIDEVHMLSISAFNALLKTLEEPPSHVVFVLATTEAHKVPVTIRSRCQHIPFHRIAAREICERLEAVCSAEGLNCNKEALWEISRQADGALRDGLSMLEQVSNMGRESIELTDVEATLSQGSRIGLERWLASWHRGDMASFTELDKILAGGASIQRFLEELFSLARNLWLTARWKDILENLDASEQEKEYLKTEAPLWKLSELESLMQFLASLLPQARLGLRSDVLCGLLTAKMAGLQNETEADASDRKAALSPTASPTPVPLTQQKEARATPLPASSVVASAPAVRRDRAETPPDWTESAGEEMNVPDEAFFEHSEVPEKTPASAGPLSPGPVAAEPESAPLDASRWESFSEERWIEAMAALHDREFLLYCALLGAGAFTDSGEAGPRLILDVPDRYAYEVLKLDRNRFALKKALAAFSGESAVVLRHGDLWVACGTPVSQDAKAEKESTKKVVQSRTSKSKTSDFADFVPPDFPEREASVAGNSASKGEKGSAGSTPEKEVSAEGLPFDGLVREVTRWMRGQVVMVRRSESELEDDLADVPPGEE